MQTPGWRKNSEEVHCLCCVPQMMPAYGSPGTPYGTPMYPHSAMYGVSSHFLEHLAVMSLQGVSYSDIALRYPSYDWRPLCVSSVLRACHVVCVPPFHAGCATVHGVHHAASTHPGEQEEQTTPRVSVSCTVRCSPSCLFRCVCRNVFSTLLPLGPVSAWMLTAATVSANALRA